MSEGDARRVFVDRITASRKYSAICPATVRDVYEREQAHGGSPRKIEARARKRLHRLWAGYLGEPAHEQALRDLDQAFRTGADPDPAGPQQVCRDLMATHDSSRERLPILESFYDELFAVTGTPDTVLDLACALNPLALRWMHLPRDVPYRAYDINARTVALINHYFRLEGREPTAEHRDILVHPVDQSGGVALLLKMYHCLEHRRRGAGWEVVSGTPARGIAVSFPARNLSGRSVDIVGNYEPALQSGCHDRGWSCRRLDLETEIVLVVEKD